MHFGNGNLMKFELINRGLRLGQDIRLTSLRYVDSLMVFPDLVKKLFSFLGYWRKNFASAVDGMKTKIVTTCSFQDTSYVEISGTTVAILHGEMTHECLGRKVPDDLI